MNDELTAEERAQIRWMTDAFYGVPTKTGLLARLQAWYGSKLAARRRARVARELLKYEERLIREEQEDREQWLGFRW